MISKPALFLASVLVAFGCGCSRSGGRQLQTKEGLIAYINDPENGLRQIDSIGKVEAVMIYRPVQLLLAGKNESPSPVSNILKDNLNRRLSFILSFSVNHRELLKQVDPKLYGELIQTMAFRMREFVHVFPDKGASIAAEDCQLLQTYGMGAANNLLIVLDRKKLINSSDIRIQIKEFGLNIGDLNYSFKTENIKKIPELK